MTTTLKPSALRDKLIAAFEEQDRLQGVQPFERADACLAVLAAEPVSEEAVFAAMAAHLDDMLRGPPTQSNETSMAAALTAGWRAMLGVAP